MSKFISGGCSFTFGNELSDDDGVNPSIHTWAHGLYEQLPAGNNRNYLCVAKGGSGNSGIARRVFQSIDDDTEMVVVMWSFLSRYDWAMPRHQTLENTRWASISPWDTSMAEEERHNTIAGSEPQQEEWKRRDKEAQETGVKSFADSLYKYAANEYHELYLSWKSIIWLQNILEKKNIPFMFTLADNSLFYSTKKKHSDQDQLLGKLYKEIDFTKWYSFGDRMMGFNQWSLLEDYERGTTHPLDKAHKDATILMLPTFKKLIGGKDD
tara:strand:- start:65 stop:865 length:801 start_codon:yes stop_codon:yes gene_type:complete